ncbi:hypothetical protein CVT24_006895 [Panaeolus cyanescens]|uniref:Reverse transcriptase domain-containing protein n=1 Tax=Panaeolus cyanescens TaxID=181874 RepID=A0A409YNU8_9AGAR|nr:hypothetical protein CVT24_006895 [Panaeolus cyanescens]
MSEGDSSSPPPPLPPATSIFLSPDQFEALLSRFAPQSAPPSPPKKSKTSKGKSRHSHDDDSGSDDDEGIPAFVNTTSTDGTSSSESFTLLFPHVSREVLVKILRHDLDVNDLHKLDPTFSDREVDKVKAFSFEDDDEGNITIQRKAVTGAKTYPNLSSVLAPLFVFFEILHTHAIASGDYRAATEIARASSHYCGYLVDLNRTYREMQGGNYKGWWVVDSDLKDRFVFGNVRSMFQPSASKTATVKASGSKPKANVATEVCFNFNKGSCVKNPCPSGRGVGKRSLASSKPPAAEAPRSQRSSFISSVSSVLSFSSLSSFPSCTSSDISSPPSPEPLSSSLLHSLPFHYLFPPRSLPPLRPNSDPRCNIIADPDFDSSPSVSSPLIFKAWAYYLKDYPDTKFVNSVLNIIRRGANIGFSGVFSSSTRAPNLPSAFDHPEFLDSAVDKLVSNGQVIGPFSEPPFRIFRTSPIGSITRKRNPAKRRMINHLSWPKGSSVNDGIPDDQATISYDMFERAIDDLVRSGQGSLMAKLDLKEAFRHVPIRPEDWPQMGFSWDNKFYFCTVLTFGLRSAPYIFNLFSEALHWIIQRHIPAYLRHYLDDFFAIFSPSIAPSTAFAAVDWIQGLGSQLGLSFQLEKTLYPRTVVDFLGLDLDSTLMQARLPADKLAYLQDLVSSWSSKRSATLRETQELTGFLQFASQVIPAARTFIRRIIDFSMKFHSPFQRLHIPTGCRADLHWWKCFASAWNGVRLLAPSRQSFSVFTDASGSKGIGGYWLNQWFSSRMPRKHRTKDIQFKELFAILHAILCWGDAWSDSHVNFYCDNQAVVAWMSSGTARSSQSMPMLRVINMMAAYLRFTFSCIWIPTHENSIADAASRFQYSRMFELNANFPRTSCYRRAALYLYHGLAASTRKTYSSPQRSFLDFILLNPKLAGPNGAAIPATTEALCEWVAWLADRLLKHSTIKSYLSAVRSMHVDAGVSDENCSSPMLQRVLRGVKLIHGAPRNPKLPIDGPLLDRIAQLSGPLTLAGNASFDAAIKVAWAGFLRCGEFTIPSKSKFNPTTHLSRSSITFYPSIDDPSHVRLSLPASKTDPFRKGVSILLAKAQSNPSRCPVEALRKLFTLHPAPKEAPLFVDDLNEALPRDHFIKRLKSSLTSLGVEESGYSGHSFRRGAATSAAIAGFSDYEIQLMGRWSSDSYKLYIDIPQDRLIQLSSNLLSHGSTLQP